MNSWWEDLIEMIPWEKVGCLFALGLLLAGIYWVIVESSMVVKGTLGVLIASLVYIVYTQGENGDGKGGSGSGGDSEI